MKIIDRDLDLLVREAGAGLDAVGEPVGAKPGEMPRFELFHAANSICSQKVRCVLAHHGLPYLSYGVNLFEGQTYLPEYVRLRMIGCAQFGGSLASRHNGSTSASAGCDGAVVPILVDREAGEVIVDSKRICLTLDQLMPEEQRLGSSSLADKIDTELAIVDELPNYQLLMGRTTGASGEAASTTATRAVFSQRKVRWCDRYIAECAGEPALVEAYTAKRAKELSAVTDLFCAEAMGIARAKVGAALEVLERKLERRTAEWLLGERTTMADLFWGVQLLRLDDVGFAQVNDQDRLPHVVRFALATRALPSLQSAIVGWPGATLR